jgi:hypothetical protein
MQEQRTARDGKDAVVHFTITWLLGIVNLAKNGYMFVNR